MNLPQIDQILTRAIAEMAGHELETINRLEEGDVIRFPGHGIPADELAELEGLLKKKPSAETTQPSKREKTAPSGHPRAKISDLKRGEKIIIATGAVRGDDYTVWRNQGDQYVAAVPGYGSKPYRSLRGPLNWLLRETEAEPHIQEKIWAMFDAKILKGQKPAKRLPEKPKVVSVAKKPGRLTSLNKGQTVMIHQGGKRKDWYLERTTAGTYVAVAGAKMQRSKTLEGALRWLWKQSQGGMQRQITKVFDVDAIKAGHTPPEEKPIPKKFAPKDTPAQLADEPKHYQPEKAKDEWEEMLVDAAVGAVSMKYVHRLMDSGYAVEIWKGEKVTDQEALGPVPGGIVDRLNKYGLTFARENKSGKTGKQKVEQWLVDQVGRRIDTLLRMGWKIEKMPWPIPKVATLDMADQLDKHQLDMMNKFGVMIVPGDERRVETPKPKPSRPARITSPKTAIKYGFVGDEKFLTPKARLTWTRSGYKLEEMPEKGKRRVHVMTLQNISYYNMHRDLNAFLPGNILRSAKLNKNDSYDQIKAKIIKSHDAAYRKLKKAKSDAIEDWQKSAKEIADEWTRPSIQVTPENTPPITASGDRFRLSSKWDKFQITKYQSDPHDHDPSYTAYVSSSPTAARKLYKLLSANPNAIKEIEKDASGWLEKNKIRFKYQFSYLR